MKKKKVAQHPDRLYLKPLLTRLQIQNSHPCSPSLKGLCIRLGSEVQTSTLIQVSNLSVTGMSSSEI